MPSSSSLSGVAESEIGNNKIKFTLYSAGETPGGAESGYCAKDAAEAAKNKAKNMGYSPEKPKKEHILAVCGAKLASLKKDGNKKK